MKKGGVLLLALVFCTYYGNAQACSSYNTPPTIFGLEITPADTTQHTTGGHLFNGGATYTCTYTSQGNPNCATSIEVSPYGAVSEYGNLTTWPIGYHVSNVATNPGTAASNGARCPLRASRRRPCCGV